VTNSAPTRGIDAPPRLLSNDQKLREPDEIELRALA
jgi:hypothetical protein